jgi:uncharacterized protein YbaR (Trm112 family)
MDDVQQKITNKAVANRAYKEALSLIASDPRKIKSSMQHKALALLCCPVERPPLRYDSGTQTMQSIVEQEAYNFFESQEIVPTEWEFMNKCQAIIGRINATSTTVARDTAGLKPVDETKLNIQPVNPYTELTDEQLVELQAYEREKEEFRLWQETKRLQS